MTGTLCVAALAAASGLLFGCADGKAKSEAAGILRQVDAVRMAPNDAKRYPFEQLRALSCSGPDRCEARDLCSKAFAHHLRGLELSAEVERALKAGIPPDRRDEIAQKLLEANIENEQGQAAMPPCEKAVADLRIKYRL